MTGVQTCALPICLPPFKAMKMEILDGVKGTDGGAMKPFTLTFTTGS